MTIPTTFRPYRPAAFLVLAVLGVAGCDAEREEVPEIAEIESESDEMGVELEEELVLGPDDVGETFMVNGWVAGRPLVGDGFFLLTEWNRRIFIAADSMPMAGAAVRVIGTLTAVDAAIFEGWETDAFDDRVEARREFERSYYLDATSVEPVGPEILPATPPEDVMDDGASGDADDDSVAGRG